MGPHDLTTNDRSPTHRERERQTDRETERESMKHSGGNRNRERFYGKQCFF